MYVKIARGRKSKGDLLDEAIEVVKEVVGEGVGISAAILAMAKRLSWNDWLLFSEKCGMPVILGNTGAKEDTPAWKNLLNAIANVAPKTGVLADLETKLQAVQVGGSSGQTTYRELIDVVDRGISALYRGGDLATVSQAGDSVGSDAQDGESELMDGDGCAMVSETLHNQIDRFVIRFTCGDFEPLAGIVINPPAETEDIDRDIKVDQHLGEFGIRLSKKDMLARYGRVEATDENDAAIRKQAQQPGFGGFGGLANEEVKRLSDSAVKPATTTAEPLNRSTAELLKAFAADMSPAGKAVEELLNAFDKGEAASSPLVKEKASALLSRLPSLLPDDPATAAVIAEAMAAEFGAKVENKAGEGDVEFRMINGHPVPIKDGKPVLDGGNGGSAKAKAKAEKRQRQADNKAAGISAMSTVENGSDCLNFMRSQKLGRIAFYQGNDSEGYLHIKNNPDPNHQVMLKDGNIPNTLAYGKYYNDTYQDKSGWSVVNGDKCVFLGKDGDGVKIITAYVSKSKAAVFARRAAIENKEV